MAQNFLYKFEFVVDDLLVTRPNRCAPEEYPMCVEITFRSSVFVSFCDRKYDECSDPCAPKCGKCCFFSLEEPITDDDRLRIHVYKKKSASCQFVVGITQVAVKKIFDKVTEDFNIENPDWMETLAKHIVRLPNPKRPKIYAVDDRDNVARKEQLCPTSDLSKKLLPLFNLHKEQTGNVIIVMRLTCYGPGLVTSFPYGTICPRDCPSPSPCDSEKPKPCGPRPRAKSLGNGEPCPCAMPDPCKKEVYKPKCRRYFNCDDNYPPDCYDCPEEKPLPTAPSDDSLDCDPCKKPKPSCGGCQQDSGKSKKCRWLDADEDDCPESEDDNPCKAKCPGCPQCPKKKSSRNKNLCPCLSSDSLDCDPCMKSKAKCPHQSKSRGGSCGCNNKTDGGNDKVLEKLLYLYQKYSN